VYVYRGQPFEWLQTFRDCLNLSKYCVTSHAGDCKFATQLQDPDAPWVTTNASHARLFVVPTLLGLSALTIGGLDHGKVLPAGINGQCNVIDYIRQVHKVATALEATPQWGQQPHLFMSGGWPTLFGCARKVPRNGSLVYKHCPYDHTTAARRLLLSKPRVLVGHFEVLHEGSDGVVTLHDPYVVHDEQACQVPPPLGDAGSSRSTAKGIVDDHERIALQGWQHRAGAQPQQQHSASAFEGSGALASAWRSQVRSRPLELFFRGSLDHPSPHGVAARARMCAALGNVNTTGHLGCVNFGRPWRYFNVDFPACPRASSCVRLDSPLRSPHPANLARPAAGGACPEMTACSYSPEAAAHDAGSKESPWQVGYCEVLCASQRRLIASGDTPSSRQLYEAIELGALPTIVSPLWRETVSPIVRWEEFTADLVRAEPTGLVVQSRFDVAATASEKRLAELMQQELAIGKEDPCKLEQRRAAMMKWLPMLSWRLDPRTTSMHILAQAARQIDLLGW